MKIVKKLGRKKKEMLETIDLESLNDFQRRLRVNSAEIGFKNLTKIQRKFLRDFMILKSDDDYAKTVKALRFKHFILKKPLTQDECTYFVDVDNRGTKPSREYRLSKMAICKMEAAILMKLRGVVQKKMMINSANDVMAEDSEKFRSSARLRGGDEDE